MNQSAQFPLVASVDRILAGAGGFYTFEDIVQAVRDGKMQSFTCRDSWAVVQTIDYPRKRVVDIVFVVGHLEDMDVLESEVTGWAREIGAVMLTTGARNGWSSRAKIRGWRTVSKIYMKDLTDGT